MSFGDHLKQIRKQRNYSQEELAELLDVSRQAVSKWEQGTGYPETEKLLVLSNVLGVSLDDLMDSGFSGKKAAKPMNITGTILISSPTENVFVTCYKVGSSHRMRGGKKSPQYALFGYSNVASFWDTPTTLLGWYRDREQIAKEVAEIQQAMVSGQPSYELRYSVKTERRWLKIRIAEE